VWVMDRGMINDGNLKFLKRRRYLLACRRSSLNRFQADLQASKGWQRLPDNDAVEIKAVRKGKLTYLLARSQPRRAKEQAIRRRHLLGLPRGLQKLGPRGDTGPTK